MEKKRKARLKKLFYFLSPLAADPAKWKAFRDYLGGPLLGNSARDVGILDAVSKVLHLDGAKAERLLILAILPGKDPNLSTSLSHLRKRLNSLLEHYYKFEAFLQYRQDEMKQWSYLLVAADRYNWDDYFPWIHRKKVEGFLEQQSKDGGYFLYKMLIADLKDQHAMRKEKDLGDWGDRYQEEIKALEQFHAIQLLKLSCNILTQNLSGGSNISLPALLPAVLNEIETHPESQAQLTCLYYHILKGLSEPKSHQHYPELKALLIEFGGEFGKEEARVLFQNALNYCSLRYNIFRSRGDQEKVKFFQQELLYLYDHCLKQGILFQGAGDERWIDHGDFKNIVALFCILREFKWVETFIEQYSSKVVKRIREVAKIFALGILNFHQGRYHEAESYFVETRQELKDSHDRYYSLSLKTYYLRVLFEREKYVDCSQIASNYIKSIRSNRHSPPQENKIHLQFCHWIKEMSDILTGVPGKRKRELEQLIQEVDKGGNVVAKDWILNKIRELREG